METIDYLEGHIKEALERISDEDRDRLADLIISSNRIFIFGAGRSGLVGQMFAVRLVQLGLHVYFVGDMTTPIIGQGDLVILISNTGRTMSVTKTAQIAKRIGSHVVCVTSNRKCDLAKAADTCIVIDPAEDGDTAELAPLGTLFEDTALMFFDCMIPVLMKRKGISEDKMRSHHAIWV